MWSITGGSVTASGQGIEGRTARFFARFPVPLEALAARSAIGTPEECVAKIRSFVEAGCTKYVLWPVAPREELVSRIEMFGREILSQFM